MRKDVIHAVTSRNSYIITTPYVDRQSGAYPNACISIYTYNTYDLQKRNKDALTTFSPQLGDEQFLSLYACSAVLQQTTREKLHESNATKFELLLAGPYGPNIVEA